MSKKVYYTQLGGDGAMDARLIRHLPEPLRRIGEVAGLHAAVAIAEAKGGAWVYFPGKRSRPETGGWLLDVVDEETAEKLRDEIFPEGEWVMIPMAPRIVRLVRVREWTLAGMSLDEMVPRLRCHRRSVIRARAWLRSEGQLQRIDHAATPEAVSD
jgi:hypothetical protein